jgi:uncharacterized protein
MRIFAFTDIHAHQGALAELATRVQEADVVLCAGDMSVFGMGLYEVLELMNSWNKPIYLIHGNHEDEEVLVDVNEHFSNLHFVHGKEVEHEGLAILGWGGGGFSKQDPELKEFAKQYTPKANRVFMIHGPPYGTAADKMEGWGYVGCKTRREVIEKLQPFLVLCGHIHENFGAQDKIGKSIVLNPGPLGKFIVVETEKKVAKKKSAK